MCKSFGAARHGGASSISSRDFVAGNFSPSGRAYDPGAHVHRLSGIHPCVSRRCYAKEFAFASPVFAFVSMARFLGMGPVTICVDSFGLCRQCTVRVRALQDRSVPNVKEEIKKEFGFEPDFEHGKDYLEEADGAGNTSRPRQNRCSSVLLWSGPPPWSSVSSFFLKTCSRTWLPT